MAHQQKTTICLWQVWVQFNTITIWWTLNNNLSKWLFSRVQYKLVLSNSIKRKNAQIKGSRMQWEKLILLNICIWLNRTKSIIKQICTENCRKRKIWTEAEFSNIELRRSWASSRRRKACSTRTSRLGPKSNRFRTKLKIPLPWLGQKSNKKKTKTLNRSMKWNNTQRLGELHMMLSTTQTLRSCTIKELRKLNLKQTELTLWPSNLKNKRPWCSPSFKLPTARRNK